MACYFGPASERNARCPLHHQTTATGPAHHERPELKRTKSPVVVLADERHPEVARCCQVGDNESAIKIFLKSESAFARDNDELRCNLS